MLRRIKRFLGLSTRAYFPNNEVAPTADGSILSRKSTKSTKSERKQAKKDRKKSPLADTSAPAIFHVPTPPTEIVIGGEDTIGCSESETDRQTVITDSLPYRDPSDKVYLESPPNIAVPGAPESSSSTRSIVGSDSIKSRMNSVIIDAGSTVTLPNVGSIAESVYSVDFSQDTDSQNSQLLCDSKSRELPVDCDIPNDKPPMEVSPIPSHDSTTSSIYMKLPKESIPEDPVELGVKPKEHTALKRFNDELDGLLKKSAPPFQVSTARLPPMLKELPPPATDDSMLSGTDEFDDSKNNSVNNSVARILNETHESMMRSPENKHLRSCGY
ncbi:hypothetical protein CAEBREN_11224 [Caenorhabditis brenneri]|uniref:Uncharacterized protein n=1 Tax=Caenorhabditis brenneri TaxID=135651 RepID=G0NVI9_CAEBE|nr:hypothetical protein CAEBREN_11224 [Caenorhabditis brenneri]